MYKNVSGLPTPLRPRPCALGRRADAFLYTAPVLRLDGRLTAEHLESLEPVGDNRCRAVLTMDIAAVTGHYDDQKLHLDAATAATPDR